MGNKAVVDTTQVSPDDVENFSLDDEENLRYKTARLARKVKKLKHQAQEPNAEWLNEVFSGLWPHISKFAAKTLKDNLEPRIQAALPSVLTGSFSFDAVTLGDSAPQLDHVTATSEGHTGHDHMESCSTDRDFSLKFNTVYRSTALISVSVAGTSLGIQEVQLEGVLTVVLRELFSEPPFFSGMAVFFADTPSIKMSWKGPATVLYLLKHAVRNVIYQHMHDLCVIPKSIATVFDTCRTTPCQLKATCPPGCLLVHLVAARGLNERNWHFFESVSSSPYAKLRIGGHEHRSKTLTSTCSPQWDQEFMFFAFTQEQLLRIDILNEDSATGDDFFGCLAISVANILLHCSNGLHWFPLSPDSEVDATTTISGELQIAARWMPVSLDHAKANMIETPGPRPQALLCLGLHSIRIPPAPAGMAYAIEVSCNGKDPHVMRKTSSTPIEELEVVELKDKIAKLRSLNASDEDIADILSIPMEALEEEEPHATSYTNKLRIDESFLWLVDVPKLASVEISVMDSNRNRFSLRHHIQDCISDTSCARREILKSGEIKVDVFTKVLVVDEEVTPVSDHKSPSAPEPEAVVEEAPAPAIDAEAAPAATEPAAEEAEVEKKSQKAEQCEEMSSSSSTSSSDS